MYLMVHREELAAGNVSAIDLLPKKVHAHVLFIVLSGGVERATHLAPLKRRSQRKPWCALRRVLAS